MFHNSQDLYYRSPSGAVEAQSMVRLALDLSAKESEAAFSVRLHIWQEGTGGAYRSMRPSKFDKNHYFIDVAMPDKGDLIWYYFAVEMADGSRMYYGNNQAQQGGEGESSSEVPPAYQITVFDKGAKTPDWFKRAVIYQIFPDRFYRHPGELPKRRNALFHCSWDDPPMYTFDPDSGDLINYDFYGGNLRGIMEKLPYLKQLGVSAVYLNPVFESRSNHHYDTGDYHKIDSMLGTNEDFAALCQKADELGLQIILDGVFSHTGSDSIYFNSAGRYDSVGAAQSMDSPYYEWYDFSEYPDKYSCWWNFTSMPNVKEMTPSYLDFIIRGKDSVLNHWMGAGAKGWRLDVIDELPEGFTRLFYEHLKELDEDAVVIGEVWEDASNKVSYGQQRKYLCGSETDSAMNYPLRRIMLDFLLGRKSPQQVQAAIASQQENYPAENLYAMMNLISSHDVERALTLLGEAPDDAAMTIHQRAKYRLDEKSLQMGKKRLIMAAAWQMTLPGAPSVYYGDEIGMQGYKDPHNRAPYRWDAGEGGEKLRSAFAELISLRNSHPVLQTGWYVPAYAGGDVLAYMRSVKRGLDRFGVPMDDSGILVVLNRGAKKAAVSIDVHGFCCGRLRELCGLHGDVQIKDNKAAVQLEPLQALIFEQVKETPVLHKKAGVLLHPTSLPSRYGIGDLGQQAYDFIDWLKAAGQSIWQVLPLNPVGYGASPYQSPSAFAGNTLLISPEKLAEAGLLSAQEIEPDCTPDDDRVDFVQAAAYKEKILRRAFSRFKPDSRYEDFCREQSAWLDDYALFASLKKFFSGKSWFKWPEPIRRYEAQAVKEYAVMLKCEIAYVKFAQYIFFAQWHALHAFASQNGIKILGDVPIFPSHDSSDVWTNQAQFNLNPDGTLKTAAGVPPDYFSADGQLWGNPHYRWNDMKRDDYAWWRGRIKTLLNLVDIIRIDHFRGFEAYWEVPGDAKTAKKGRWVKGPGRDLFDVIKKYLGDVPVIAEDLGVITPEVEKLKHECGFPGMKVLQFELYPNGAGTMNFTCPARSVAYTGTHDNNTTLGWLKTDIAPRDKAVLADFLGASPDDDKALLQKLIELAYASPAQLAVLPLQDVLALDGSARMNMPGTVGKNWGWRFKAGDLNGAAAEDLRSLAAKYGRV